MHKDQPHTPGPHLVPSGARPRAVPWQGEAILLARSTRLAEADPPGFLALGRATTVRSAPRQQKHGVHLRRHTAGGGCVPRCAAEPSGGEEAEPAVTLAPGRQPTGYLRCTPACEPPFSVLSAGMAGCSDVAGCASWRDCR